MLHVIQTLDDPFLTLLKDDPVRPEIPVDQRVSDSSEIFVLLDHMARPRAVTCVSYNKSVPATVQELYQGPAEVAVFYTIWSYDPGAGRDLILAARQWQIQYRPTVHRWVTLSPKTEMARKFHLRNGAGIYRENADTVNYEYC